MIYVLSICIGMTWGMCNQILTQEFDTLMECQQERQVQYARIKDLRWAKCEKKKDGKD